MIPMKSFKHILLLISLFILNSPIYATWLSVDPLSDKYPHISPYAYCNWNPVKNIDPNGKWFETVWDVANVVMDVASLRNNIRNGNVGDAIVDGVGLVLDAGSVLLPFVPAGAGTAIKASRTIDKVSDASRVVKSANTEKKTFQTYIKRNPKTGEVYVGRTSGTKSPRQNVKARDSQHHKNVDGFGPAEMVNSSTNKDAIRGQEQRLIDQYGGAKSSGGTSGNVINGVSPNNPNAEKYINAAKTEFGEL